MDSIHGTSAIQAPRGQQTHPITRPADTRPQPVDRVTLGESEGLERPLKRSDFQRAVFAKTGAAENQPVQCRPGDDAGEKIRICEQKERNARKNGATELADRYHREAEELKGRSGKEKVIETPSPANPKDQAPDGGKAGETPKSDPQPPAETPPAAPQDKAPTPPQDPAPTTPQDQAPPQPPTPAPNPPQPPARDPGMLGEDGRDTGRGGYETPGLGSFLDWLRNLGR